MHFTGMNALNLYLDDGTQLEMNFEAGTTIVSLIFPILGVFIGLKIASADPFFLEVEQSKRKDILVRCFCNSDSGLRQTQLTNLALDSGGGTQEYVDGGSREARPDG